MNTTDHITHRRLRALAGDPTPTFTPKFNPETIPCKGSRGIELGYDHDTRVRVAKWLLNNRDRDLLWVERLTCHRYAEKIERKPGDRDRMDRMINTWGWEVPAEP